MFGLFRIVAGGLGLAVALAGCVAQPKPALVKPLARAEGDVRLPAVLVIGPAAASSTSVAVQPGAVQPVAVQPAATDTHGMVLVPAGLYWTGCDLGNDTACRNKDGAFRQVHVETFYMDRYEVTVSDYRRCVAAGGCDWRGVNGHHQDGIVRNWANCNWNHTDREDHPLNCVSWQKADEYCGWAGKRLPSEDEWEKAARGADKRTYPWGEAMITCDLAITNETGSEGDKGCGASSTFPVGSRPNGASPYGIQDIVGNVWEWTATRYVPQLDERIDPDDDHRVGKGGCWGSGSPFNSRISWSHHYPSSYGSNARLGFRCAKN